ncbi:MAG: TIGR03016 family PEP-CTERM system-associated outer membrane protein [Rhodospirillales bacterium]|nr:TIGR03016 family PEP-CTERM system-associated outer membrane protein [Rhodospirillales bacterium]
MPTERAGPPSAPLRLAGTRALTLGLTFGLTLALVLAAGGAARAFTPATDTGPFPSPFPDAGGTAATGTGGTGTGGTGGTTAATPATSFTPPDYRYQGNFPLVAGGLPVPGFTVAPTVSLYEEFNDNIFQSATDRRADFITVLTPGITVTANTPRLDASLQYSPSLQYYARNTSQSFIAQQMFGVASLVAVPDTLFVNGAVFATVAPTNGGFIGPGAGSGTLGGYGYGTGAGGFTRQNTTQIFGESVTPYLTHRFGEIGNVYLGLALAHTSTSNAVGGGNADLNSADLTGQFQSGPILGRFQDTLTAEAYRSTGSSIFGQARRESISDQLGYAVTNGLQIFGALGYEDIAYSGTGTQTIRDMTWRIGFSATPGPHSFVSLSWGHDQGNTGFTAQANYAVTARTTIAASYTRSVTTYLQQVAAALGQAGVNANGVPVNAITGLPLNAVNGTLIVQDNVSLLTTLDITLTTLLDRDTLAFSLDRTTDTPLSGAGGFSQEATIGTASWTHLLSPRATATGSFSYGTTSIAGFSGDSTLLNLSALLQYQLGPTTSLIASYQFFSRRSTVPGFSVYDDIVLVGITKRF